MSTITFFRQARRDGGIRTGIDIDDRTVLSHFDGEEGDDPTLLWYVDVRCSGPRLPREVENARVWLERHEEQIVAAIETLAKRLPEGLDPSEWPLKLTKRLPGQVGLTVACSAVRRIEARRLDSFLRDVAAHWSDRLKSLGAIEVA